MIYQTYGNSLIHFLERDSHALEEVSFRMYIFKFLKTNIFADMVDVITRVSKWKPQRKSCLVF